MHNQTDQMEQPMRDGHAVKLASRVGSGGHDRSGESPDAPTFQCNHFWSTQDGEGRMQCLWCGRMTPPTRTWTTDNTTAV